MAYNLLIIHKWYGFILCSINDDEHSIGSLSGFAWIFYLQFDVGGESWELKWHVQIRSESYTSNWHSRKNSSTDDLLPRGNLNEHWNDLIQFHNKFDIFI